ncbi:MAG TPA: hypothetical protein VM290_07995 [Gaiellaceae bacterium]|nr:hypothetical protein [Gaiellaceae bacterium]
MRKIVTVLGLALVVGVTASVARAVTTVASANGHGTLLATDDNGREVKRQFSFTARRHADGTVTGQAVLVNPAFSGAGTNAPYRLHVDITCMHVVGNIAIFGGTTERTNDPGLMDAVFFSVQDNGEPGKGRDRISRVFFWDDDPATTGDPQACLLTGPTDFPLEPIAGGNIQVRPTAP